MNGSCEAFLVRRVPQPALLLRIGDEGRLHQHRRDVRRGEHGEAAEQHLTALEVADTIELAQHLVCRVAARADCRVLRQVEQHRGEHAVLVVERDAADQVSCVLALGQPAGGLVAGPSLRQDVHGGTANRAVDEGIGMDRYEHVGLVHPGAADPLAQRHEVIASARQHRAHPGLGIDALGQQSRHAQRDVLLTRAAATDRARVLAAVTGVHRDHEIALRARRVRRLHRQRPRCGRGAEIDHQPVTVTFIGGREETLGLGLLREVEHDSQSAGLRRAEAH